MSPSNHNERKVERGVSKRKYPWQSSQPTKACGQVTAELELLSKKISVLDIYKLYQDYSVIDMQ
jgi:hypothetical protein